MRVTLVTELTALDGCFVSCGNIYGFIVIKNTILWRFDTEYSVYNVGNIVTPARPIYLTDQNWSDMQRGDTWSKLKISNIAPRLTNCRNLNSWPAFKMCRRHPSTPRYFWVLQVVLLLPWSWQNLVRISRLYLTKNKRKNWWGRGALWHLPANQGSALHNRLVVLGPGLVSDSSQPSQLSAPALAH